MKYQLHKSLNLRWQIVGNDKYKWSECKKLINTNTGKEIKKTINGGSVGYWIGKEFISLNRLKEKIELIPKSNCPF